MQKKIKKYIFYVCSAIFLSSILYSFVLIFTTIQITEYKPFLFKNNDDLQFHKKYSRLLHHVSSFRKGNDDENNRLFSTISKFNKKENILFQGDSWIEQIHGYELSLNRVKEFSKKNRYGLINGGTTSFSPSLMMIQLKILEDDFNLKPTILIAYIDQTDIGDELCRYDKKSIYQNNKLIAVNNESFSNARYDFTKIYRYSEIELNHYNKIIKNILYTNFNIKFFFYRTKNRLKEISELGITNRNASKCWWSEVSKYLLTKDLAKQKKFEKKVKEYLNFVTTKKHIKKIILVTFPHKNNLEGVYKTNVSDIVENLVKVKNSTKIKHLNFTNYKFTNEEVNTMYLPDDPASHLNEKFHSNLFISKILSEIN